MTWICPDCKKKFRNKNQLHSCYTFDIEFHLKNKPAMIRQIVELLIESVSDFGKIEINPVKTSIQVKNGATFLSIKPKKNHVEIEFQLKDMIDRNPVYKSFPVSKNRILHCAVIEEIAQLDDQLIGWLEQAYHLMDKN